MGYTKGQIVDVKLNTGHVGGAVHDGDTIYVLDAKTGQPLPDIRIAGLDAPEAPKWNGSDSHGQPLNQQATEYMQSKVTAAPEFQMEYVGPDAHGREVFKVWVNGRDVARDMVWDGYGFAEQPGPWNDYVPVNLDAQEAAKAAGRGIWSPENVKQFGQPKPPWQYRSEAGAGEFEKHFRLHAVNARTRAEIPGKDYNIFVNGKKQAVVDVYKYGDTVNVKVTSSLYESLELQVSSEMDDSKPVEIELTDKGSTIGTAVVQFVTGNSEKPPEGIDCVLDATPPQKKTTVAGQVFFDALANGREYTVSYTPPGFVAGAKKFTAKDGMAPVVIHLTREGDGKDAGDTVPGPDKNAEPEPVSEDFPSVGIDDSPYNNSSFQGYYTSAQARVYIGNLFLDELNSIQFALASNAVPIYGYCDRDASAYAQGRALVQGQLVLNYVADWYLYTALKNHKKMFSGTGADDAEYERLKAQFDAAKNLPDADKRAQAIISASQALRRASASSVRKVSQYLREQRGSRPGYDTNACYWPGTFDILVEVGEGDRRSIRRIEKCKIVQNEQILDESGQPLYDAYSFIGRRLR